MSDSNQLFVLNYINIIYKILHRFVAGLRGAISYALSLHLGFSDETRHVIITTTLIIVLVTTVLFGGSTMPLMKVTKFLLFESERIAL